MSQIEKRASGAIAALQSLKTGLANVSQNIASTGGDPYLRLLRDGSWVYGQDNVDVEEGSYWAINPESLMHGFVAWSDNKNKANEVVGERMVLMSEPLPNRAALPDVGWEWDQQLSFQLKCVNGEDAGEQTLYKTTSEGGKNAVKKIINAIMAQLDTNPEAPVPVVKLETDHYQHKTWGKTYVPIFVIVKWMPLDGPDEVEAEQPEEPAKPSAPARTRRAAPAKAETEVEEVEEVEEAVETEAQRRKRELQEQIAALEAADDAEVIEDEKQAAAPVRRRRRS